MLNPQWFSLAAPLSDAVVLEKVALCACFASYEPIDSDEPLAVSMKVTPGARFDGTSRLLHVLLRLELDGTKQVGKRRRTPLTIKATFRLTYETKGQGEFLAEQSSAFARTNGIYNAWPYWREFVQNTIARMNLPPLVVPVFHLFGKSLPFTLCEVKGKRTRHASESETTAAKKHTRSPRTTAKE